ncbi:MAG: TIGR04168 family protein [Pseudanabaenaceae cyanobacterium bins.39]|nr:TIGR04168 family protein [Pseudanabaenaceae cyanobacterium bins.39]
MSNLLPKSKIKIAIVGDVHHLWQSQEDYLALQALEVDLVLFVGDLGNESVETVQAIANLPLPKAIILGNHDAHYSSTDLLSKHKSQRQCPYDRTKEDRVQQQLDILGDLHVGYGCLDFPQFQISVIGSRPFSWGSSQWKKEYFYKSRFGVHNLMESAQRITESVAKARYNTVIFLGHNGPSGLGAEPHSICGKDWKPVGGDYGDPDFAMAIEQSYQLSKHIPLVTFGHMHHQLRHTPHQTREVVATNSQGTIFYNAACCPRIINTDQGTYRNFSLATLESGQIKQIALVWLDAKQQITNTSVLYHTNLEKCGNTFLN